MIDLPIICSAPMIRALLWLVTALYAVQGAVFIWQDKPAAATILAGYVIANLGLIWATK
jgi:hypothetical protein